MVCLEKLDRSDFEEVYRIMEQSFPADERRKKIVGKAESRKSCSGGGIAGGFPEKKKNRIL